MNVNKLVEKGEDALRKRNYDYAISIFLEAVSFAPNNRKAREGLRRAELKKHENSYPSAALLAIFGLGARLGMFFAGLSKKSNPEGYMMACERYLTKDPKSKGVNMALGAAAAAGGHLDAAIFAFETAAEYHPGDTAALKKLGYLLWKNGDIHRAHEVFEKVVGLNRLDQEAIKARKNLAAEASLKETGFETAQSSLDLVKDKGAAGRLEQEARLHQSDEDLEAQRDRLEKEIEAEPENATKLVSLAEVLEKTKDHKGAMKAMDRAIAAEPGDLAIQFTRGGMEMNHLEMHVHKLRAEGREEEAAKQELELRDLRVEENRKRIKAYPTDLKLRFQLAVLLLERNEYDEAIVEFQQTVRDPRYKSDSLLQMGRAFAAKEKYDLAVRQLLQALEGQTAMTDRVKEIRYELGDVYDRLGDVEKARQEFSKIYEVDIGFRDVGDRLHKLESAG